MNTHGKILAAVVLLTGSSLAQAVIIGDVTAGGSFSSTLSVGDGWGTNNGVGVDFWTLNGAAETRFEVSIDGAFDYGISLYQGVVESDFLGSFDNNGDYSYNFGAGFASFIVGTPDLFGPFNSLSFSLPAAGSYTLAVGGVNGSFQSLDYNMDVNVLPAPATLWLLGGSLLGLFGLGRRS